MEIARLVQAIADGQPSQSLMSSMGKRERELQDITDKLLEPQPGSIRASLAELRDFAIERMTKIRELLSHPENVTQAHEVIAEHIGQLALEAVDEGGKKRYIARGKVDFFSGNRLAHSDGAGGQNRTGYARLFRAA